MLVVLVGEGDLHLFAFVGAEVEDVADFGGFDFFEFITVELEFFNCSLEDFFVDSDVFLSVEVEGVFAGVAKGLKFVAELRESAAACEGDVGVGADAEAVVDAEVGLFDLLVVLLEVCFGGVERVHVFHDEFATTENAGFSAEFISEFSLELIDGSWEVFIAVDVVLHHAHNWLFVGPCEADFCFVFELGFEPDVDELVVPAAGDVPGFAGLEVGHD